MHTEFYRCLAFKAHEFWPSFWTSPDANHACRARLVKSFMPPPAPLRLNLDQRLRCLLWSRLLPAPPQTLPRLQPLPRLGCLHSWRHAWAFNTSLVKITAKWADATS
ncbi:unnamed protein product [Protopolystoma xenopodis]|uniref:Uncharacterized protein n=1 Tax=Protopolystoma xenopodis TaxID=117903 RepID=A0A448XHD2_9PLAT|nr:unnamed protein product [Protopolystoma xenopodis]